LAFLEAGRAGILGGYAVEPAKIVAYLIAISFSLIFSVACMIPAVYLPTERQPAVLDRAD
jgi:hypothetical protein